MHLVAKPVNQDEDGRWLGDFQRIDALIEPYDDPRVDPVPYHGFSRHFAILKDPFHDNYTRITWESVAEWIDATLSLERKQSIDMRMLLSHIWAERLIKPTDPTQ